jgi:hypothetical protein
LALFDAIAKGGIHPFSQAFTSNFVPALRPKNALNLPAFVQAEHQFQQPQP